MKLHLNKKLFQEAIQATAQYIGIPEVYVEKDYWVSLALLKIFSSDIKNRVVFKGGTCLSKCHHLIHRFSEDIDLVIVPAAGEAANQSSKRMKLVSKIVGQVLPEKHIEGYTNKKGNIRKTVHQYDRVFDGRLGQVGEHLVIEASLLGNFEPFSTEKISTYIQDFMIHTGTDDLLEEYEITSFDVQALCVERTLCEKIMSLVRFSQAKDRDLILPTKIRHIYDLHLMLQNEGILSFFQTDNFFKMMLKVGEDDYIGYKNNNEWLKMHPANAVIFHSPETVWPLMMNAYQGPFRQMVYGEMPTGADMLDTLYKINKRIKLIDWHVGC